MMNDKPDVIINIIDASNIERNLYLTTQILELGIPTVLALNMMDIVEKNGDKLKVEKLSQLLGCPIVETSAIKGKGIKEVVEKAIELSKKENVNDFKLELSQEVESSIKILKKL